MWGEAKPEEEGNGTWFGGALGHRQLDQMAKNAVEKALADKGIPVATAATLLFESSSDAIDEDMDKFIDGLANNTPNSSQFDEDSFNGA